MELFRYYGVDWVSTAGTLTSLWLLSDQRRSGWLIGSAAALGWFGFGVLTGSMATMLANGLLVFINLRGYQRWRAPRQG